MLQSELAHVRSELARVVGAADLERLSLEVEITRLTRDVTQARNDATQARAAHDALARDVTQARNDATQARAAHDALAHSTIERERASAEEHKAAIATWKARAAALEEEVRLLRAQPIAPLPQPKATVVENAIGASRAAAPVLRVSNDEREVRGTPVTMPFLGAWLASLASQSGDSKLAAAPQARPVGGTASAETAPMHSPAAVEARRPSARPSKPESPAPSDLDALIRDFASPRLPDRATGIGTAHCAKLCEPLPRTATQHGLIDQMRREEASAHEHALQDLKRVWGCSHIDASNMQDATDDDKSMLACTVRHEMAVPQGFHRCFACLCAV
jgi:hypothetical protein